jgi:chromosome segregation ATPase
MQCYFNAIEIKVRNELKTEVEASIGEDENKNLRVSLESEVKDLETEIGALEVHLDKAKSEEERLRKEKMAIFEERSKKTAEIESEHTKETERLNEQIAKIDKEIGNGKEYLAKQEKEIESCKQRLEEQKFEMHKLLRAIEVEKEKDKLNDNAVETTFSRSSEKQELIDELNRLKAQIVDLQAEQANLQKILTSKLNK